MVKLYVSLLAIALATKLVLASSETVGQFYTERDLDEDYADGKPNFGSASESGSCYSEKELPTTSRNTMRRTGKRRVRQLYTEPDLDDEEFFERGYDDDYPALEARFDKEKALTYAGIAATQAAIFLAPLFLRTRDLEDEEELPS